MLLCGTPKHENSPLTHPDISGFPLSLRERAVSRCLALALSLGERVAIPQSRESRVRGLDPNFRSRAQPGHKPRRGGRYR
jgi:hypothetical protein